MLNLNSVKSFDIGGITYPVKYVKEVENDSNLNGISLLDKHSVHIRNDLDADRSGQVFCHELTHCILSTMGEDIGENEKFVDLFGTLLHQVLKTIK